MGDLVTYTPPSSAEWQQTNDLVKQTAGVRSPIRRLLRRVEVEGECWTYQGPLRADGYCQIQLSGKRAPKVLGHRLVYEFVKGPISDELQLDHLCRVRHCVRPTHLEPVTQAENIRRGASMDATRAYYETLWNERDICPNGHALAEVGIYIERRGDMVTRKCRACRLESKRRSYQRLVADPIRLATLRHQQRERRAAKRSNRSMA
jgi:HNH endonuclease